MRALALALLLAAPAAAKKPARKPAAKTAPPTAEALVVSALDRAQALYAAQEGKDAREERDLEAAARALGESLKPLGWKAAAPLGAQAANMKRPPRARLLAASWLALTRDPAAFPWLEALLLDPEQDEFVRAAAAQSLPLVGAPDHAARRALCAAVDDPKLPRQVLDDALIPLSKLGCPGAAALHRVARAHGPRPEGRDLATVTRAVEALGASRGEPARAALLELLAYLPARTEARAAVVRALSPRARELALWSRPAAQAPLLSALRTESDRPDTAVLLARAAAEFGAPAVAALTRLSRHPDAEVLVTAAEGLARLGAYSALPEFEAVAAGALNDPRFSPREGRPDPAALLSRLEAAIATLRRVAAVSR